MDINLSIILDLRINLSPLFFELEKFSSLIGYSLTENDLEMELECYCFFRHQVSLKLQGRSFEVCEEVDKFFFQKENPLVASRALVFQLENLLRTAKLRKRLSWNKVRLIAWIEKNK